MKDVLDEVGVTITPASKKEIDRILHEIVGVPYKDCSSAWKRIKEMVKGSPADREQFVGKLRNAVEQ